jgi:HK97 family phage major capsid protein
MDNEVVYRSAYLKNLQGKELSAEERTALVHGEYAIPQETANKIWGKLELYPILNAIDVMHIPGNVVLPVEGTINNAAVVAMGTAATDSADTLSAVSLGAYKLIKTVEITADVSAMAVPAFEDWLVDRLANKLFRLAATKVAAGTGTNEPTGLATITATGQTYTAAGITYADLLNIISKLPSEYLPNAKFVMSRDTFWKGVKALKTDNDVRVVNTDVGSSAAYNILGFPVILEDQISTDVIFGDLKEGYVLNFAKDIAVDRDESVAFRTGSTVFRGMALADGKPTGVGLVRFTKASL